MTTAGPSPSPSLKRSLEDASIDDTQEQEASKRPRVTFDESINVRLLDNQDDSKPLEYIREEVKRAIDAHLTHGNGNDQTNYLQIAELFNARATQRDVPSTNKLSKYLQALILHVGSLGRECSRLVHAVTDVQWLGRDETFVGLFRQFLALLLSAHGGYTGSVFKMIIGNFKGIPSTAGQLPDNPPVSRSHMNARLHATLRYLLSVLPSASGMLSGMLARMYPASEESKKTHINFAQQVLKMTEYAPELKSEILTAIVDRLVKMDVEVQVEMDRVDDDIEETGILDEDPDEEDDSNDSDDDDMSTISLTEDEERYKTLRSSVAKIDSIMDMLFTYYDTQIKFDDADSFSPSPDAWDAMENLLSLFDSAILPKHRSRHTQFLVFHFAQRSPHFMDWFEGACASLTRDRSRTALARTSAVDYLASFVARGRRVDAQHVVSVFDLLLSQCDEMRDLHFRNAARVVGGIRPDKTRYGLYYACVQALLYIFCFRWRALVTNAEDLMPAAPEGGDGGGVDGDPHVQDLSEILETHADDLRWAHRCQPRMAEHVYGPLNPLKVCNSGIVKQFAHVGRATRFLYVYPLLENNKKIRLHQGGGLGAGLAGADGGGRLGAGTAVNSGVGEAKSQLEAYFPFDPYLLPKSRRWLEGDYVEWVDVELWEDKVAGARDEEDDEEDEQEEGDREEAGDQMILATTAGEDVDSSVQGEQEMVGEGTGGMDARTETDREST
ncbi:MAG: hypothetical protein Q9165_003800 [Trypethelium subeluteriae]